MFVYLVVDLHKRHAKKKLALWLLINVVKDVINRHGDDPRLTVTSHHGMGLAWWRLSIAEDGAYSSRMSGIACWKRGWAGSRENLTRTVHAFHSWVDNLSSKLVVELIRSCVWDEDAIWELNEVVVLKRNVLCIYTEGVLACADGAAIGGALRHCVWCCLPCCSFVGLELSAKKTSESGGAWSVKTNHRSFKGRTRMATCTASILDACSMFMALFLYRTRREKFQFLSRNASKCGSRTTTVASIAQNPPCDWTSGFSSFCWNQIWKIAFWNFAPKLIRLP